MADGLKEKCEVIPQNEDMYGEARVRVVALAFQTPGALSYMVPR